MSFNRLITALFVVLLFANCRKRDNETDPLNPSQVVDTLLDWQKISITGNPSVTDINFQDYKNGFITSAAGISRSSDSGKTWTHIYSKLGGFDNFFPLSATAFFVNNATSLGYSFDGGINWAEVSNNSTFAGMDLVFTSPSTGYITSTSGLQRTTDTGKTWKNVLPKYTNGIWLFNTGKGICYTTDSFKTTTDGINWAQGYNLSLGNPVQTFYTMFFSDNNHGWICAMEKIGKTADGGVNWTTQVRPHQAVDIQFINNLTGFYCSPDEIYKTTDGGNTWTRICKIADKRILEIFFLDENTGWACGLDGLLLRYKK